MRLRLIVLVALTFACGGRPPVPKRLVVESDVGSWKFRRFQGPILDIEVWVDGNKGEAYTASYITESSEKAGKIAEQDLVNVMVTKYEKPDGVTRETVRLARRLAAEKGYQVSERKIEGVRALAITAPSETWVIWPSGKYVVKVGAQGRADVPYKVVESYGDRYPSALPGGSLEGPLPPGTDKPVKEEPFEYDPNNPKANIKNYDPDKVKLPEHKEPKAGDEQPKPKSKQKSEP